MRRPTIQRYQTGLESDYSGYFHLTDQWSHRKFLGRKLPHMNAIAKSLDFWMRLNHPHILGLHHYLDMDTHYLAVLQPLPASKPLSQVNCYQTTREVCYDLLRDVTNIAHFLFKHQLWLPFLDLDHMIFSKGRVMLIGHETALAGSHRECPVDHRYAPPEWAIGEPWTEHAAVYHLGAILYHLLTGNVHTCKDLAYEMANLHGRWKNRIKPMLSRMLKPNPLERPGFASIWQVLIDLPGRSPEPAWINPPELPELDLKLSLAHKEVAAVALQQYTDDQAPSSLMPFALRAEKAGYLVFHRIASGENNASFQVINEIIAMMTALVEDLDRPDLAQQMLPLSQWQNPKHTAVEWRRLLARLLPVLVPGHYCGILLIIENIQHLDKASMAAIMQFSSWLSQAPFLFILSGHNFNHSCFNELKRRLPFKWEYLTSPALEKECLQERLWHPCNNQEEWLDQALEETNHQENLLRYWATDYFRASNHFSQYLEHNWRYLDDNSRSILQVMACSNRPLSAVEIQRQGSITRAAVALRRLSRGGFVKTCNGQWSIAIPALKHYCFKTIPATDVTAIRTQLYRFEVRQKQPDLVQQIFLAHTVAPQEMETYTDALAEDIFIRFDTTHLWRLAQLNLDVLLLYSQFASSIRGLALPERPAINHVFLQAVKKANRLRIQQPEKALEHLMIAANKRQLHSNQKAYLCLIAAEVAASCMDHLSLNRILRTWERLDLTSLCPSTHKEWCLRLAKAALIPNHPLKHRLELDEDHYLFRYLQAWQKMLSSDFIGCMALLDEVLPQMKSHHDLYLRGDFLKLYGNTSFRNYLPLKAIAAYEAAGDCFRQLDYAEGLGKITFNLACAKHLAGHFDAAHMEFQNILDQAETEKDRITQCETLYYIMVCHLFQNNINAFEERYKAHQKLARRLKYTEEHIKGIALYLHRALTLSKPENKENLKLLNSLLAKSELHNLLLAEVDIALRLVHLSLNLADPRIEEPYPRHTRWRHQLVDKLRGYREESFASLSQRAGSGYFGAYNIFLLKEAVAAGLVPKQQRDAQLAKIFWQHDEAINSNYAPFLEKYLANASSMGEVSRELWQQAIGVLEDLRYPPQNDFANTIVNAIKSFWPFTKWGIIKQTNGHWKPVPALGEPPVGEMIEQLQWTNPGDVARPKVMPLPLPEGTQKLLLLTLERKDQETLLLWLSHHRSENQEIARHFQPLFRFYGHLLSLVCKQNGPPPPVNSMQTFGIVGSSQSLQKALEKIKKYGNSSLNIYIWGESGTGKELAAKAIHLASERADQTFRAINCSQFPHNLVESEIFGHVRGAFTGADEDRAGILELADGGTLFLDEIGDISPKVQSLLLRVFQEGEFSRIGEHHVRKVDIRFVTATNKNITQLIEANAFREDLYYRMVEEEIRLPALRQRMEDLPALAYHFLKKYAPEQNIRLLPPFFQHLSTHLWPGNIRELETYIRKVLVTYSGSSSISSTEDIAFTKSDMQFEPKRSTTLEEHMLKAKEAFVRERLKRYGGNRSRTAKSLAISRQALHKIMAAFDIR